MNTQYDHEVRVVSLSNLEAMCAHVSGFMCHTFKVEKVTRSRVHVSYSNEDEYARTAPMVAVFPCYPGFESDNPNIILDFTRVLYDNWNGYGWQAFTVLLDCPTLWRDPISKKWKA